MGRRMNEKEKTDARRKMLGKKIAGGKWPERERKRDTEREREKEGMREIERGREGREERGREREGGKRKEKKKKGEGERSTLGRQGGWGMAHATRHHNGIMRQRR